MINISFCRLHSTTSPERGKFLPFPKTSSLPGVLPKPSLTTSPPLGSTFSCIPAPDTQAAYRQRYPIPNFREKYFTNFSTSLPHLGYRDPLNVNLCVTVGPEPGSSTSCRLLHTSSMPGSNASCRQLHTSSMAGASKSSSKVEETVIRLKERAEQELAEQSQVKIYTHCLFFTSLCRWRIWKRR